MQRSIRNIRKAGVAAMAAVAMLSGLAFAPAASAAPAGAADLALVALASPTIGVGKAGQPAGSWRLSVTPGDTLTNGDQILIHIEDADGTSPCLLGNTIAFSDPTNPPTATVTGTATVLVTTESSGGVCPNDTYHINVTASGTATIDITNVKYTVGSAASVGAVAVTATLNGTAITVAGASNAYLTTVGLTANTPPKGASQLAGGAYNISPIVLAEQTAAGADAGVCIYFSDNIESTPAPAPTVTVTGGTDTATVTTNTTNDSIRMVVTPSSPASVSTFTISNVPLERDVKGVTTSVKTATIWVDNDGTCNSNETVQLSVATTVGYVGSLTRFGGSDRFSTAQIMFEDQFPCVDNVVIARADQFPDALAASYLASTLGTGVLLTSTNSVPAVTLDALRRRGVNNVYLLGGTQAISAAVASQLDATTAYQCGGGPEVPASTLNVSRIFGADRYETARRAAEFPGLSTGGSADINGDSDCGELARTAIVTSGENFPDALAAGPLAYSGDITCGTAKALPLLLTTAASVPASTLAALTNLNITNVIVLGGTSAVSAAAVSQLTANGYTVRRIAGANRQATAVALGTAMIKEWGYDKSNVTLTRGDDFADALAGGPFRGDAREIILMTASPTSLSADTSALLGLWETAFGEQVDDFTLLGGVSAVSASVAQAALDAASLQ